jgi:ribosomal protein L37AE/L43A
MSRIKMVCSECGSEDVRADAFASWDVETQLWELATTFDKGHACEGCGQTEIKIEEVAI